jgi:hypothetical protein
MNLGSPSETSNDSALVREIEACLAVNPSPEFVAHIRNRIAKQPEPSSWTFAWHVHRTIQWAFAGGIAAALLLVVFPRLHPGSPLGTSNVSQSPPMLPSMAAADLPVITQAPSPRTNRVATFSKSRPNDPEVLLSPEETNAIRRYLTGPPIHWVEVTTVDIEPMNLPETPVTPLPMFDPFRAQLSTQ